MKFSLVAFSALLLATAAQAQSDTAVGGNATPPTAGESDNSPAARRRARDERVSCRQVIEDAGSRLSQRVCLTARQWRERGGF